MHGNFSATLMAAACRTCGTAPRRKIFGGRTASAASSTTPTRLHKRKGRRRPGQAATRMRHVGPPQPPHFHVCAMAHGGTLQADKAEVGVRDENASDSPEVLPQPSPSSRSSRAPTPTHQPPTPHPSSRPRQCARTAAVRTTAGAPSRTSERRGERGERGERGQPWRRGGEERDAPERGTAPGRHASK